MAEQTTVERVREGLRRARGDFNSWLNGEGRDYSEVMASLEATLEAFEEVVTDLVAAQADVDRYRAGLERVREMAVRPKCKCGLSTGTGAIWHAADNALVARQAEDPS